MVLAASPHLDNVPLLIKGRVLYAHANLAFARHNRLPASMERLRIALAIFERINDKRHMAQVLSLMSHELNFYESSNDYFEAVHLAEEGLRLSEELEDKAWIAQGLNHLGNVYHGGKQYIKARDAYQGCFSVC